MNTMTLQRRTRVMCSALALLLLAVVGMGYGSRVFVPVPAGDAVLDHSHRGAASEPMADHLRDTGWLAAGWPKRVPRVAEQRVSLDLLAGSAAVL